MPLTGLLITVRDFITQMPGLLYFYNVPQNTGIF